PRPCNSVNLHRLVIPSAAYAVPLGSCQAEFGPPNCTGLTGRFLLQQRGLKWGGSSHGPGDHSGDHSAPSPRLKEERKTGHVRHQEPFGPYWLDRGWLRRGRLVSRLV